MKNTLNTYDIATALRNDENANWSRSGAFALAEHLEDLEDQLGIEMELDIVSFRCGYSEYSSALGWAEEHFGVDTLVDMIPDDVDSDEEEAWCREYICDHGQLIEFTGGIIVSQF
jgi:hypothetical protein